MKVLNYLHPQGYVPLAIGISVALALGAVYRPTLFVTVPACVWLAAFFRDPVRVTPVADRLAIAPADGVVRSVDYASPPAESVEAGKNARDVRLRIAIFMNVFDCHINRSPVAGKIVGRSYRPGAFFNASFDKAGEQNERACFAIKTRSGAEVLVAQIAGLIARRIVSFKKEGDDLNAGERFGLIRFGSRVDVYLPRNARPTIAEGMRTRAGETVIARFERKSRPKNPSGKPGENADGADFKTVAS